MATRRPRCPANCAPVRARCSVPPLWPAGCRKSCAQEVTPYADALWHVAFLELRQRWRCAHSHARGHQQRRDCLAARQKLCHLRARAGRTHVMYCMRVVTIETMRGLCVPSGCSIFLPKNGYGFLTKNGKTFSLARMRAPQTCER